MNPYITKPVTDTKNQQNIKLVHKEQSYKIVIPSSVEAKIRHLCSVVHDVEWSGVLFYTKEGTFEDNNLIITCKDILPMDIGSEGFTEFKDSEDIVAYMCEHPELLETGVYTSLIHSHNHMETFLSGTDQNTLLSEGIDSNHFVSLIVNNAGNYTAAITRRVKQHINAKAHIVYKMSSSYDTWEDEHVVLENDKITEKDKEEDKVIETVEWYDLDIIKEPSSNDFNEIDDRLSQIKNSKKAKAKPAYNSFFPKDTFYNPYFSKEYIPQKYNKIIKEPDYSFEDAEKENMLYRIASKILTGNVFENTVDLEPLTKDIDKKYEKLFGEIVSEGSNTRFEAYMDSIIENILETFEDVYIQYVSPDEMDDALLHFAEDLYEIFDKLPSSHVMEEILNTLYSYMR